MVAKCANPSCDARFLHLREGALFSVESGSGIAERGLLNGFEYAGMFRPFQYFWLCPRCCKTVALRVEEGRVVTMVRQRERSGIAVTGTCGEQAA